MTEKFKIGDKVQLVRNYESWLFNYKLPDENDTILTVVDDDSDEIDYINANRGTIELTAVNNWPKDFQKVSDAYFASGQGSVSGPSVVTVSVNPSDSNPKTSDEWAKWTKEFTNHIQQTALVNIDKDIGVYRPDVDKRKADKIRIELFDDGFPNAILEIAKVLTWAQKVKGYKDHDWVNLPDAENALKGAASRHRRDANQQKMAGVGASERLDPESKHHHLAHQAFNILAELELILIGKIV